MEKEVTALRSLLQERGAAARTIENYIGSVRRLDRTLGGLVGAPTEVSKRLTTWRVAAQKRIEAHTLSSSSVMTDLAAMRAFYDAQGMTDNPARAIRGVKGDDWLPRPIPPADVERLLAVVKEPHDRAMVELYLNGLRNVEVCRLDVGMVAYSEEEQVLVLRVMGKGSKLGEVVLHPGTSAALAFHLLRRFGPDNWHEWVTELADPDAGLLSGMAPAAARMLAVCTINEHIPVFVTSKGKRMTRRESNRRFSYYRNLAKLPAKYGPHALRHTCATELLERGVDLRVVQEVLRHRSLRMTERYTKVSKGLKASAMRRLPIPAQEAVVWTS